MSTDSGEINQEELRGLYRQPSKSVVDKAIDHIDAGVRDFIAKSPLFVMATTDGESTDASPRGGPPGFVRVLDEQRVAFGDLTGNNRLDSYTNLMANPWVGMLFVVPGLEETLRVNGTAALVTDPAILDQCTLGDRVPKAAVCITVTECYLHCGAALRRSGLWDSSTWPTTKERPSPGEILKRHAGVDDTPADIEAGLAEYYDNGVWEVGGA